MRIGVALRCVVAFILVSCGAAAWCQTFDLDRGREALVSLDGMWRFQPGDSPEVNGRFAWAEPGFDDARWVSIRSDEPWSAQGYAGLGGFAWYRFNVTIPAGERPTSLLLAPMFTSYQVYVDGVLVGGRGPMPPARLPSEEYSYHLFPLTAQTAPAIRTLHVALRMWNAPVWRDYIGGGPLVGGNLAGDPGLLRMEKRHRETQRNTVFVDSYSFSLVTGIVGIAILCLFVMRPAEREYLWFAAAMLALCGTNVLAIGEQVFYWMPIAFNDFLDACLTATIICSLLLLFSRVLASPRGTVGRVVQALAMASPPAAIFYALGWGSPASSATLQILLLLPAVFWILWTLLRCAIRGNTDARLLLIPALLDIGFYFADNIAIVLAEAGWNHLPRVLEIELPLPPFRLQLGTVFHLIFVLALLVFLIRRFALARKGEERMAQEFEAAREVQQMLLPDDLDQCPAYRVDSIYQPADEVGGDFFQQIGDGSGGILIVVGDVSGKGLPAALIVSVLVGAIRAEAAHGSNPAQMLASLNDHMVGRAQGGFVTCLAAHLSADGVLTMANAGHLPPYLNGNEIDGAASLPLGIVPGAHYEVMTVALRSGDRLTFLSDGVVEAQTRSGELLGFERARALSGGSAASIAEAARKFGQKDDVTVVTVEYCGMPTAMAKDAAGLAAGAVQNPLAAQ
ncbi:MAG: SpoIIE family protein phosphatase [Acidobacteriota bacterium]